MSNLLKKLNKLEHKIIRDANKLKKLSNIEDENDKFERR